VNEGDVAGGHMGMMDLVIDGRPQYEGKVKKRAIAPQAVRTSIGRAGSNK